ncbi:hypothetical protein [Pseudomonas brenneri]
MTTNQTIDGVPRSTLEKLVTPGMESGITDAEWEELRALLDAESAPAYVGVGLPPVGMVCEYNINGSRFYTRNPEWVRVTIIAQDENSEGTYALFRIGSDEHYRGVRLPEYFRPIRTPEQPAPVAVVLPDQMQDPGMVAGLSSRYAQGWNSCLDEVTRLNTK